MPREHGPLPIPHEVIIPETKETLRLSPSEHRGGMLSIAGELSLVQKSKLDYGNIYTYPSLAVRYSDDDPLVIANLMPMFQQGGNEISMRRRGESVRIEVQGKRAGVFVEGIDNFTPGRKGILRAYRDIRDANSNEEKMEIYHAYKNGEYEEEVSGSSDYERLVLLDTWVAGIYDARGSIHNPTNPNHPSGLGNGISSTKEDLLRVMANRFGGTVEMTKPSGSEIVIDGQVRRTQHDSFQWRVYGRESQRFISTISPHLRLRGHHAAAFRQIAA